MSAQPAEAATAQTILNAARSRLLEDGYAGLSTRRIALEAGVPLSQVHYHFGSKGGMVLALLEAENERRLSRQTTLYSQDIPLWRRYEQACDVLEDDIESGYVRVLLEMIAAGWTNPEIAAAARSIVGGWYDLLTDVATEAAERFGGLGPFSPAEVATLIGNAFIGSEALLLLGFDRHRLPIRASLRRLGEIIKAAEEAAAARWQRGITTRGSRPMRARQPDDSGYAERDGVKLRWETFGDGEPTVVLLPTWSIIHSRHWKAQVPYLARHHRVVTFDGRGCGGSDRPVGAEKYTDDQFAADTIAVLDATGTKRAVLVGLSAGGLWTMLVAADAPERVLGVVTIGAAVPLASRAAERTGFPFEDPIETTEGWAKYNRHYWERDFEGFLEFFFGQMFSEPHSTKQIEDCVGWGLETEPGSWPTPRGVSRVADEGISGRL